MKDFLWQLMYLVAVILLAIDIIYGAPAMSIVFIVVAVVLSAYKCIRG